MQITTTARRIAHTLNAARPDARVAFDADGHEVGRVYGPEPFCDFPGTVYRFTAGDRGARQHHTYAAIQEGIDTLTEMRSAGFNV